MRYLPDAGNCIVDPSKISNYLLDGAHPKGAAKARYFAAFGFNRDAPAVFADALKVHAASVPVHAEDGNALGRRYVLRCRLPTPDGRDPCIRSVWIVPGNGPPRLITAYPG